jgi:hypothetical protein
MYTPDADLTPEQNADAERIYLALREATEEEHRQMARLLACRGDDQLFGQTEYEVRDLVHRTGARAIQAALDGRKKGGTGGRA